jgi:uncharacterized protein
MEIAIVSDTHMPRGGRRLPPACIDRLRQADVILHAGDISTLEVLEELRTYGEVIAVRGNVDDSQVRAALPERRTLHVAGTTIGMLHDSGQRAGRLERLRRAFADADAVIFGHSHLPLHERAPDGFQIFNPGSPTERRRAPRHTMGIARAHAGKLTFELVQLG